MEYRYQIWQSFSTFHSSINAQKYLLQCYKNIEIQDPEKRSYENCYPFIYYLDHGKNYYQLSAQAPISIKPILLFYGMVQLLKACLLTVDPQYPESTSVLAHGVSTRKRKKRDYDFLKDEVKIQRNGLFPHVAEKMFHVKHLESEKYTMEILLARIPEMNNLFKISLEKFNSYRVGQIDDKELLIPIKILDDLKMTNSRFASFLKQQFEFELNPQQTKNYISIQINDSVCRYDCSPMQYDYFNQALYLPKDRVLYDYFPEILVHYLLLYNLSMISRYETEWWSELLRSYSSLDYPFINNFLDLSIHKVPYFIYQYLNQKIK
ncbi:YaaC family protein [Bacillus sp. Marseille-P3661]|uniref:YaaC family protein n=1 Tax=Bacillus sp. Marseille-P3661 TaxID=1936234 RepID=UPI000C826929|nr:YaaC family protein [Bacillus sp. Marseille-P3661]